MNKRDRVLSVVEGRPSDDYTPAGFFTHFDPSCHTGEAAIQKHLEFFRYTDMDFVKIQYELKFPPCERIRRPADWANAPHFDAAFFEPQLAVVRGLVEAAKAEALVIVTLYSPFMCAGHLAGADAVVQHMAEDPDAVCKGMEIVTDSLAVFVDACIRIGVDGFYHSTQGGEHGRLPRPDLFAKCVRPYDLRLMEDINRRCAFNVLHVCDYHLPYADLTPFLDYPGHVVNVNPIVAGERLSGEAISRMFGRPFMGGMDRHGPLAKGDEEAARMAAREALADAPTRHILAADCTVPPGTPWANLRAAIDEAHRRGVAP